MAFTTGGSSGGTPAPARGVGSSTGSNGLPQFNAGAALSASDLNNALGGLQQAGMMSLLAGVLIGGVCAAAGLNVTIPAGTAYFAGQVWTASAAAVIAVPDGAASYLWGCADGQIRKTTSPAAPVGFTTRSACLLTVATATGGVATVTNTAQQRSRCADSAARTVQDGPLRLDYGNNIVDASASALRVPAIGGDPITPLDGMVWVRQDTGQLCYRVAGVTKRVTGS